VKKRTQSLAAMHI